MTLASISLTISCIAGALLRHEQDQFCDDHFDDSSCAWFSSEIKQHALSHGEAFHEYGGSKNIEVCHIQ